MTDRLPTTDKKDEDEGLDWARIAGFTLVVAIHAAALLLLLAPATPPQAEQQDDDTTRVVIIEPPPPPEEPPVVFDEPSPMDTPAPPPAPPAPPAPQPDIGASVDISSKNMNPPQYPPAAARAGIEGTVILVIDVDASGNVTNVSVEKSSRNRDLDRAAMQAARRWRFNPSIVNGQPAPGRVRVPVDFRLGG
jgi:protein TonB